MKRVFKSALVICLLICMSFGLTACFDVNGKFECSGKTFGYAEYKTTAQLDNSQKLMLDGMVLASYQDTQFKFNEDGSFVWKHTENGGSTILAGNWEIVLWFTYKCLNNCSTEAYSNKRTK